MRSALRSSLLPPWGRFANFRFWRRRHQRRHAALETELQRRLGVSDGVESGYLGSAFNFLCRSTAGRPKPNQSAL